MEAALLVWGYTLVAGVGYLVFIETKMNRYLNVLYIREHILLGFKIAVEKYFDAALKVFV